MFDVRPILFILGLMLLALGVTMMLPALADLSVDNPDWKVFAAGGLCAVLVGGWLALANRASGLRLEVRQGFLLTAAAWLAVSAFAALPFLFSQLGLDYSDAFFEAISGLTTTGATVLVGIDALPPGILLWRALLQWLGGIGIIAMAIAVLPFLRVGGMQLFRMEWSDRSDKILPRPAQIAAAVGVVYVALTVACAGAYRLAGMNGFDAVTHAMTTVSTGGYSTSDQSIAHFDSAAVEWVAVVFMIAGSLPFILYVQLIHWRARQWLWRDSQVQFLAFVLAGATALAALWLWLSGPTPLGEALRLAAFNVASVVTTTGYATADYGTWGHFAVMLFLLLTLVGGCTGSTAGGLKMFRLEMLALLMRRRIYHLVHPHGVFVARYNRRPVTGEVIDAAAEFVVVFLVALAALSAALSLIGLDAVTSLSGAASALANVGPGLGPIIGPAGNYATLPDAAKWVLAFGMLLGRLELFTLLVLFSSEFWRG